MKIVFVWLFQEEHKLYNLLDFIMIRANGQMGKIKHLTRCPLNFKSATNVSHIKFPWTSTSFVRLFVLRFRLNFLFSFNFHNTKFCLIFYFRTDVLSKISSTKEKTCKFSSWIVFVQYIFAICRNKYIYHVCKFRKCLKSNELCRTERKEWRKC